MQKRWFGNESALFCAISCHAEIVLAQISI